MDPGKSIALFHRIAHALKDWKASAVLPDGITVRIGRWNVPGRPIVILVKFDSMYAVKDQFYSRMWELYGVDSLHAYGDYDEACAFSHAAAIVIESISRHHGIDGSNIVAHFDEWTTGMGLLALKSSVPQIATVFTTHATSIGPQHMRQQQTALRLLQRLQRRSDGRRAQHAVETLA